MIGRVRSSFLCKRQRTMLNWFQYPLHNYCAFFRARARQLIGLSARRCLMSCSGPRCSIYLTKLSCCCCVRSTAVKCPPRAKYCKLRSHRLFVHCWAGLFTSVFIPARLESIVGAIAFGRVAKRTDGRWCSLHTSLRPIPFRLFPRR